MILMKLTHSSPLYPQMLRFLTTSALSTKLPLVWFWWKVNDATLPNKTTIYVKVICKGAQVFICETAWQWYIEIWQEISDLCEYAVAILKPNDVRVQRSKVSPRTSVTPNIRITNAPFFPSFAWSISICWKTDIYVIMTPVMQRWGSYW